MSPGHGKRNIRSSQVRAAAALRSRGTYTSMMSLMAHSLIRYIKLQWINLAAPASRRCRECVLKRMWRPATGSPPVIRFEPYFVSPDNDPNATFPSAQRGLLSHRTSGGYCHHCPARGVVVARLIQGKG